MKRRNFLKAVGVALGAGAVLPVVAHPHAPAQVYAPGELTGPFKFAAITEKSYGAVRVVHVIATRTEHVLEATFENLPAGVYTFVAQHLDHPEWPIVVLEPMNVTVLAGQSVSLGPRRG